MEYDIFISYSRADHAIVDTFVQRLESAGYKVWIDRTGIYTGTRFKAVLVQAIENSEIFLFFSSKAANASSWTAKEIAIAVDRQKKIIPIKLDSTRYNPDVEFDLINLDYVDYTNKSTRDQELDKLMRSLERLLPPRLQKPKDPKDSQKPKDPKKPKKATEGTKGNWFSDFIKNHLGWAITVATVALLLIVGVPMYCSRIDSNLSPAERQLRIVEQYTKAAEQGDAEAQYNLGVCYEKGEGVPQNYEEAAKWYMKAAEQGHANAQNNLGLCYYVGNGVRQNHEEAVKWYRKAATATCSHSDDCQTSTYSPR